MIPHHVGDLVLTHDGYHALVLIARPGSYSLFLANGTHQDYAAGLVVPVPMREGTAVTANFAEVVQVPDWVRFGGPPPGRMR